MDDVVSTDYAVSYDGAPSDVAQTVARCDESSPEDPDLAAIVAAWPTLPDVVRSRVVGLVEGATLATGTGTSHFLPLGLARLAEESSKAEAELRRSQPNRVDVARQEALTPA